VALLGDDERIGTLTRFDCGGREIGGDAVMGAGGVELGLVGRDQAVDDRPRQEACATKRLLTREPGPIGLFPTSLLYDHIPIAHSSDVLSPAQDSLIGRVCRASAEHYGLDFEYLHPYAPPWAVRSNVD